MSVKTTLTGSQLRCIYDKTWLYTHKYDTIWPSPRLRATTMHCSRVTESRDVDWHVNSSLPTNQLTVYLQTYFYIQCRLFNASTLLVGLQEGHLALANKNCLKTPWDGSWCKWAGYSCDWLWRVSACRVIMFSIRMTGYWEPRGNQVIQIYLENSH